MKNTFEITREQIHYLSSVSDAIELYLRNKFPESFETELKTGIWYKQIDEKGWFYFLEEVDETKPYSFSCKLYGFNNDGSWGESGYRHKDFFKKYMTPATEEEVFERLKEEAVKRGFIGKDLVIELNCKRQVLISEPGTFQYLSGILFYQGAAIFNKGIWVKICITKEQAEKELGKKII